MKKVILLTAALFLSANANAGMTDEEVFENSQGFYKSEGLGYIVMDTKGSIGLSILTSKSGAAFPVFISYDSDCKGFDVKVKPAKSSSINGKLVKMVVQCHQDSFSAYYPKTAKGQEYLRLQLRTKNKLTIDAFTFNTEGYLYFSEIVANEGGGM